MAFQGDNVFVVVYDRDREVRDASQEVEPHQPETSVTEPKGDRPAVEPDDAGGDEEAGYGYGV